MVNIYELISTYIYYIHVLCIETYTRIGSIEFKAELRIYQDK